MNHVFYDIIDWYALVYLNNILVYSKTADNYEKHLCEVFLWLKHTSSGQNMQSVSLYFA